MDDNAPEQTTDRFRARRLIEACPNLSEEQRIIVAFANQRERDQEAIRRVGNAGDYRTMAICGALIEAIE